MGVASVLALLVCLVRGAASAAFCAPGAVSRPVASPAEVGSVIDSLFGSVSSRQAFARQREAEVEAAERFASARNKELTYGEFDLDFFFSLLQDAAPRTGESFCDVGSGCGRLVLAAALAHEWESAAGVEVLEHLHVAAVDAHAKLGDLLDEEGISLAPCRFLNAEADEALPELLQTGPHVAFVFATCWPGAGPFLPALSATLASNLPLGSRVICVDKQLIDEPSRWRFELVAKREAPNYATHTSVGYVYRLEWTADAGDADGADDTSPPAARGGTVVMREPLDDDDVAIQPPDDGRQSLSLGAQMR